MKPDLVVLGGGPAGITASIVASSKGKKVTLIAKDFNGVRFASGLFDVFIPPEEFPEGPYSAIHSLFKNHPNHVLRKIFKNEEEFHECFEEIKKIYSFYRFSDNRYFLHFISDMGTFKPSWGACEWICSYEDIENRKVVVAWPERLMGRTAYHIAEFIKQAGIEVSPLSLPFTGYSYYSAYQKGKPDGLKMSPSDKEVVLLPPLRWAEGEGFWEVFPTQESINGLWLEMKLKEILKEKGVQLKEKEAKKGIVEKKKVKKVVCEDGEEIEGDVFLLATGKFSGGAFTGFERESPYHKIFPEIGLKIKEVMKSALLCNPFFLHSHSFFSISVEVDSSMRAKDEDGDLYENLFCAGSIIANVDPFSWNIGTGFSTLTAFQAVKKIYG